MNSSVGNDNYRPEYKPPKPIKENSGWLSSNMAQLMVFLNGLILTITAFATLNVFINEIVREELLETTDKVQQQIFSEFEQAEKSINALSTILAQADYQENKAVQDFISSEINETGYFHSLYLIKNNEINLLFDETQHKGERALFESFVENSAEKISNMQDNSYEIFPINRSNDAHMLYVLAKKQIVVDKEAIVTAAIFDFKSFVRAESRAGVETIQQIKIIDQDTGDPFYIYQKRNQNAKYGLSQYSDSKNKIIANKNIAVEVGLNKGTREAFLQKIPLLMLLFGVTLTLIGTLYVRNNQMQSKKLSTVNKELAHKNFELNQQITERERLNDVIQKSAKEHQTIINAVSDIIVELSDQGKIQFLNDAWKTVTGFDLERSIGRSIFDMIYVQDQAELKNNIQELVSGTSRSYRTFTRIRSADGKFRAVEMSLSLVRETSDKELHLVGTITDVEERRRAERALSEAEKKYRTIVENAAGGIYQVTPDGQLLSVNPAYARILKYDSADVVLRDIQNAHDEVYYDSEARSNFLKEISSLNISKSKEMLVTRADEKVIWVNENVRPVFDEENNLLYYEGSMEDIDKRKKAELALKEAKTGSDLANRAKSEFLANMSHELRTPLNAIIGFSDIIRTEAFGKIEHDEYKEYAGSIFDSGNNLLKVINEILDVSRIEAGERTLNESAVNIRESVLSSLSLMEGKIKTAKVRIENKITNTDLSIIGESQAVKQMILNLMSNAVKFSNAGGMIMLDAEIIDDGRMRLSVTDTGIGMNDDELEKAVSPFGQVDSEHSKSGSGTGLGLTLVKSLVELHGGELEIVSQKGIGTTATVIFPAKRVIDKSNKKVNSEEEKV